MIPKIIHLTWFSGEEFPPKLKDCINTWKCVLPDFEIKLWNMEMALSLNIPYVNEALDAKKWAFAGDVIRAYAVWKYGGVYMDTDIYLLKRFDEFLKYPIVFFMETNAKRWELSKSYELVNPDGYCLYPDRFVKGRQIQAAMFMAEKGHWCLKEIIDYYRTAHFLHDDGSLGTDLISPWIYSKVLERFGFRYVDKDQYFKDIRVFNSSYVGFSKYEIENNTISLHLAEHAWDSRKGWKKIKFVLRKTRFGSYLNSIRKYFSKN